MSAPTAEQILHIEVLAKLEEVERAIHQLREGTITSERLKQTLLEMASHYLHASQALGAAMTAAGQAA